LPLPPYGNGVVENSKMNAMSTPMPTPTPAKLTSPFERALLNFWAVEHKL
jgi:hypothetical protein